MTYNVYHITTVPSQTNAFTTGRMETWTLKLYESYMTLDDAKHAVLEGNLKHSDLIMLSERLRGKDREDFYQQFCFDDDKYLGNRRFFLGKPKIAKLKEAIASEGINVL